MIAKLDLTYRTIIIINIKPSGDGLGRSKLVRLVSLNKVQAVLSQICDYSPVSVNAVLELAEFYLV